MHSAQSSPVYKKLTRSLSSAQFSSHTPHTLPVCNSNISHTTRFNTANHKRALLAYIVNVLYILCNPCNLYILYVPCVHLLTCCLTLPYPTHPAYPFFPSPPKPT